jgi:TolC family type I secretion outer membrane protein|uniref:TolC family protein n=1 Tax=Desulfobacca acetoxidans TaxID=60893 RepID=A0A7C3ZAE5_9BACT
MRRIILSLFTGFWLAFVGLWPGLGPAAEAPRSLNLKEALALAWKANPNLRVSRLEELIADQEVVRARSGFLPKVRNETSQTIYDMGTRIKVTSGLPGGAGVTFPLTNNNFWTSKFTVDQTLFDFWATPSRYQAAILGQTATRLDTAQVRDNIFLLVCQGYFRVLRGEKLVEVAQQEVVQFGDQLKDARNLFEFGVVTYNDVLQAEVSLADAKQRLITAQNDVVNAKSALNKIIGLPIATPLSLAEEKELAAPAWKLAEASDMAIRQRSDLKAAVTRIDQGEKNVTQAKAQFFPRFYAQAGQFWQQNFLYLNTNQWFAIFGLQWSLFSGLDTRAQVRQARERVEQLRVKQQDLTEQVRLDVQTAYLAVTETADRIRVTEKAVAQGEENLRLNRERYREQVGTATDVVDAVTLLTRTRVNYFNALYDHQLAKAQLLWAVGAINDLLPQGESRHVP